jgi:cytochrome P450
VSALAELEDLGRRIGADVGRFVREGEHELRQHLTEHPQPLFDLLRTLKPVLLIHDIAIVTRHADVLEVLGDDETFGVEPYGVKMRALAGEFILGLDESSRYERETSILRLAAPRSDIPALAGFVAEIAEKLVEEAAERDGLIDVVELSKEVPARLFGRWFGLSALDVQSLVAWTLPMFDDIFFNVGNDPRIHASAARAAELLRPYIEGAIAERKRSGKGEDDVLGRLLAMQADRASELSDAQIATNLIGMVIGFIPTVMTATTFALDTLLCRPDALAGAQRAARQEEDDGVRAYMWEAMRLAPFAAGVLRRARTDAIVGEGTHHATRVPAGTLTLAATESAMLDGAAIDAPESFRVGRPASNYLHFGAGLHHCFGRFANAMQIPLIAKALLRRSSLARAPGAQGRLVKEGPYPKSLVVLVGR